jgi:glucose/arabinose dehydrogenase
MKISFKVITAGILLTLSAAPIYGAGINLPKSPPIYGYGLTNLFPGVNFVQPVAIATPPGETNSLYIVERLGRIIVIPDLTKPEPKVFLDLRDSTEATYGEGGLLGIAFHPGYRSNGRFFVYRTRYRASYVDELSEFNRDANDHLQADPSSEQPLISQPDAANVHNAGDLHFGPDGYLYLSLGMDGPMGEDVHDELQAIDKGFFSAIIRIDVDSRAENLPPNPHHAILGKYRVPIDNPFVGATQFNGKALAPGTVRTEFYAIGFRNPYRFSFHPISGQIICGDVGEGSLEEVDLVVPGGNYGWPYFEGTAVLNTNAPPADLKPPVYEYLHGPGLYEGRSAIIGGRVYNGSQHAALRGYYLFADFRSGQIWALNLANRQPKPEWLVARSGISSFGLDPRDGEILVANIVTGEIEKLVYTAPENSGVPRLLSDVNIFSNLQTLESTNSISYEINTPFWSDGAKKTRWANFTEATNRVSFRSDVPWDIPAGAVFLKHFDLEMTNGVPESSRRISTRILVKTSNGVYGVSYRWGVSKTNAVLVPPQGMEETFQITDAGKIRDQKWIYPGWEQCNMCHTDASGRVLGFNTVQLNKTVQRGSIATNQIDWLIGHGIFANPQDITSRELPRLSALTDSTAPLQHKVRSYLNSNCVQCHQPTSPFNFPWDARISTPIEHADIIDATGLTWSTPPMKIINPRDPNYSLINQRTYPWGLGFRMPPIGTAVPDQTFLQVLTNWIMTIPQQDWRSKNIGPALLEGSAEQEGRTLRLSSSGSGLQNDAFFFLSKEASGKIELSGLLSILSSAPVKEA